MDFISRTRFYLPQTGDTLYVWCEMDINGGGWTLTTRISHKSQEHGIQRGRYNVGDLQRATTTKPTRAAKMADVDINAIAGPGGIRWTMVAQVGSFLKYQNNWVSNKGKSHSCSYDSGVFSHWSKPAVPGKEQWRAGGYHKGACGGWHTDAGGWTVLSGINSRDNTYKGGYTGSSNSRVGVPDKYRTANVGNDQWHQPGYIFERAAKSQVDGACKPCPSGMYADGSKAEHKNRWNKDVKKGTASMCIKCPEGTMSGGGCNWVFQDCHY